MKRNLSPREHLRLGARVAAQRLINANDANLQALYPAGRLAWDGGLTLNPESGFTSEADYFAVRQRAQERQRARGFDYACYSRRSVLEEKAEGILQFLRARDKADVYDAAPPRVGFGGQRHPRFAGDHFLSNEELVRKTALFNVASHLPKGAHLHIHFNACLAPHVLLNIAKGMDRMFITSDLPLVEDHGHINYNRCEIQFSLMSPEKESPGDLFSAAYQPRQTMRFSDFLNKFSACYPHLSADEWLLNKLVFAEEEAHNYLQTAEG